MALVIPGVQVTVVKEIVPPQLAPSGVLGLIGLTEKGAPDGRRGHAASWSRFLDLFGPGSAFSLPEAALALENGVSELVIAPVDPANAQPARVSLPLAEGGSAPALVLTARAAGPWANDLKIGVVQRDRLDGNKVFDLTVGRPGSDVVETHRDLVCREYRDETKKEKERRFVVDVLAADSQIVTAALTGVPDTDARPAAGEVRLAGGADAPAEDYAAALRVLEDEPDVDLVLAGVQGSTDARRLAQIYAAIISHSERMSATCKGRIGFGDVPSNATTEVAAELASNLVSDRFVLLAPAGVAGAVAGRVGSLDYYQSPTFKRLAGLSALSRDLVSEEQVALLKSWVVPVVTQRGRGTIVVRGLTTDGDQISVRRVADRAVRGTKMIGELFIGTLNTEQGRGALKQKLIEFLVQMQKDGALVPSTDGKDPAFKVNVYSSQADFAQGIVRVDIAVRPVRAIDYIYATILVQA